MTLYDLLHSHKNNLGIFRIIAAFLVVYGHAPAFFINQNNDFVMALLGFDYSGSLAVKFFFMLSGLLVTNSLLSQSSIIPFLIKRAVRIFPGLIICQLITVFVIGFSFTNLALLEYLSHQDTWSYLIHNSTLISLQWVLPGVFESANTHVVNASLWSLPIEVLCYLSLAIYFFYVIRLHKSIASFLLLIPIYLTFFGSWLLPDVLLQFDVALKLGGCFCLGVLAALNQEQIQINLKGIMWCALLLLMSWSSFAKMLCFYVVLLYVCLYLSRTIVFNDYLKIPGDPSYGIYIYGFLIQHIVAHFFLQQGLMFNQLLSGVLAIGVGYLSWYGIEKPCMQKIKTISSSQLKNYCHH